MLVLWCCFSWCGDASKSQLPRGFFLCLLSTVPHIWLPCAYHVPAWCLQNPQGWTLSFDCSTFPEDSWGLLLPQLRSLLQRWPSLSAADNARKLPHQTVVCSRKGEDHAVPALAAQLWPHAEAEPRADAAAGEADTSGPDAQDGAPAEAAAVQEQEPRGSLDGSVAAPAAAAVAAAVNVDRLVLELGWEVFKPKAAGDDEEEEDEPPVVDFSLTLYNLQVC